MKEFKITQKMVNMDEYKILKENGQLPILIKVSDDIHKKSYQEPIEGLYCSYSETVCREEKMLNLNLFFLNKKIKNSEISLNGIVLSDD